jgi:hypothetical protein
LVSFNLTHTSVVLLGCRWLCVKVQNIGIILWERSWSRFILCCVVEEISSHLGWLLFACS